MKEAENSISEEANIAIGRNTNSRYLEKFSKKNFTIAGIRTRDYSVASQTSYQPSHRDTRLFASAFPLHLRLDDFSTDSSRIFQSILFIYSMICRISLISLICIRGQPQVVARSTPTGLKKKKKKESTSCRLPRFNQSVGLTWPGLDSE